MANRRKVRDERRKDAKTHKSMGLFKFSFPTIGGKVEGEWPTTPPSAMMSILAVCVTFGVTCCLCCWLIFVESSAETIESIGEMFGRKPEKRQTPNGTTVEVCPPCPGCLDMGCMEFCQQCKLPPPCPVIQAPRQKFAPTVVQQVDKRQL